jgi:TetR/AcrR family transcriptional regulator
MKNGKTRNSDRTRSAIMRAAERLFAERGFAGTSMRDLAGASGISQPLIHHHFGSKQALYRAVKRHAVGRFQAICPRDVANGGTRDLKEALRLLFRFFRQNPRVPRLLRWERLEGNGELRSAECELIETFRNLGEHCQRRGEIRQDIDLTVFVAVASRLVTSWLENRESMARLFPELEDAALDEKFIHHAARMLSQGAEA